MYSLLFLPQFLDRLILIFDFYIYFFMQITLNDSTLQTASNICKYQNKQSLHEFEEKKLSCSLIIF